MFYSFCIYTPLLNKRKNIIKNIQYHTKVNKYYSMYILFLICLLSSALAKKSETLLDPSKDDYKYDNLKKAWSLLQSDFVAKSHLPQNMITLKKFNSYYKEDSITFLFSARKKKGPVEIYKASIERYKERMKSVVYEKIPVMNKITIHDTAYILIANRQRRNIWIYFPNSNSSTF